MQEPNYRILVIDDVASIHQDFRKILMPESSQSKTRLEEMNARLLGKVSEKTSLPPFQIDSAYQCKEGVNLVQKALVQKKPYAVAFVDVQMPPGEDGIETIARIWKMDGDIQTVICTAYAKYSWEDLKKRFGDTDRLFILKKPFDNLEIIQLASALTKKWNLNQYIHEQLLNIRKLPTTKTADMEETINRLKDTVEALSAINKKFDKVKQP
jgi:CheY-like chemotaxis protein